jgi:hypothetical protein
MRDESKHYFTFGLRVPALGYAREAMRHEFAAKGTMAYHYTVERRQDVKGQEARMSWAQSVMVIVGLSALGWAIIIAIGVDVLS